MLNVEEKNSCDDLQIDERVIKEDKLPCPMMEEVQKEPNEQKINPMYLPQPGDELPMKDEGPMDATTPWATGQVTYTPQAGITGLRPVADRYSITRFGPSEWRAHNHTFFQQSDENIQKAQHATFAAKQCIERVYREADKVQLETTEHLRTRANVVYRWKLELDNALQNITEEITLLEGERRRVKQSLSVITVPESIAGEFLQLRGTRLESDLVKDNVEKELTKEVALCSEIRDLLNRTREQIEMQLIELKAAKARMENDWTDKIDAYKIDTNCIKMNNESPLILWKPGATRFPAEQSTPASYEHFTRETLSAGENVRQRSMTLRSTLSDIYKKSLKDLRDQASQVDIALAAQINLTEGICQQLEKELQRCLQELANTENLIEELRGSTKGLDNAMKLAQTRLSERLLRRNVESCRDVPQFALVDEVKSLGERVTATLGELKSAEDTQAGLVKARGDLEREILIKRKTLYIDRQRGQLLRSFYPSAAALSGF
ncbi:tektin-4 [Vespa velutina]|uniref:tektin-4 n=1 Tax=Vespa velutina TaxID=202808 RepID=UPI001FB4C225|nr:tektin-4 [Vespa velutina]